MDDAHCSRLAAVELTVATDRGLAQLRMLKRSDSREAAQQRPLTMDFGGVSRADGSASFSFGKTSVLAAVYGPAEVKASIERLDRATISVTFGSISGGNNTPLERSYEQIVRRTLESLIIASLYPRSLVKIVVQVLFDDGCVCILIAICVRT